MPSIYLSPAMQEYSHDPDNHSIGPFYANQMIRALEPYLRASSIRFSPCESEPSSTPCKMIDCDAHIQIHAGTEAINPAERRCGIHVDYDADSIRSERLAQYIAVRLKSIYPNPINVHLAPSKTIRTCIPAVSISFDDCDDPANAAWLLRKTTQISRMIVLGLTDYFNTPFIEPSFAQTATVEVSEGNLNIRSAPTLSAAIVGSAPDGAQLSVYGQYNGWYAIQHEDIMGYVSSDYIVLNYE